MSHLFDHVHFDHRCGDILTPLPNSVLEDAELFCADNITRLAGYNPVLCLVLLRRSQKIIRSRYGGSDSAIFSREFKIVQYSMFCH